MPALTVEGLGLHTGAPARVTLETRTGPVVLNVDGRPSEIAQLRVVGTLRATSVQGAEASWRAGTVDHLFAALGGLGVHDGVAVTLEGPEMPILDGCAARWCTLLQALRLAPSRRRLRVQRDGVVETRASRFEFRTPTGDRDLHVGVTLALSDARLESEASWHGCPRDFVERIAPARTFAFASEIDEFVRRGLARHVPPEGVVVIGPEILVAGRPFSAHEPARHKLLDLVGDLYLYGGPPVGSVFAFRPGHGATHEAMGAALAQGVVGRQ